MIDSIGKCDGIPAVGCIFCEYRHPTKEYFET